MYFDIVKRKKLSKQDKQAHFKKLDMSINNKEAEALKYTQAIMIANQLNRFSGPMHAAMPTNSVDLTDSVDEDVSTLTSGILNSTRNTLHVKR